MLISPVCYWRFSGFRSLPILVLMRRFDPVRYRHVVPTDAPSDAALTSSPLLSLTARHRLFAPSPAHTDGAIRQFPYNINRSYLTAIFMHQSVPEIQSLMFDVCCLAPDVLLIDVIMVRCVCVCEMYRRTSVKDVWKFSELRTSTHGYSMLYY